MRNDNVNAHGTQWAKCMDAIKRRLSNRRVCDTAKCKLWYELLWGSLQGPVGCKIKSVLNCWHKAFGHSGRAKVKILKFWLLGAFLGHCRPRTMTPEGIFFRILVLRQKLSGNVKNRRRSLLSFWDINAQTLGRSETRKIGQKSAKSQNADLCRKFITERKWINFGTMIEGHNGCKMSNISEWEILVTNLNNFWFFFNFEHKYLQKVPPKIFRDFCLKRPCRGWRTRIWPKTGTGSSFRPHFGEKNEFWGFSEYF